MTKPSRNMTILRSMVLQGEAPRDRSKRNLAYTGQPKEPVNMATLAPSFMIPTRNPKPSSEPTVLPEGKGNAKTNALLPEEEKEEEKASKVRDQVQTDQVAAKAAAVQKDQEVRVDLKEKAEKESVGSLHLHDLVADFHTTTRLEPRVEAPLPLARQICLCASISLKGLAAKVKTATFTTRRFASTTRRENAKRALLVKSTTSIPMQRNEPQIQRRSLPTKLASVWLKS